VQLHYNSNNLATSPHLTQLSKKRLQEFISKIYLTLLAQPVGLIIPAKPLSYIIITIGAAGIAYIGKYLRRLIKLITQKAAANHHNWRSRYCLIWNTNTLKGRKSEPPNAPHSKSYPASGY